MKLFRKLRRGRKPWLFYLPRIFQISNGLLFIGLLCVISGASALLGLSEPDAITRQMALPFYNAWGAALLLSGSALTAGIYMRDQLIEKYSARILSVLIAGYTSWVIAAVGLSNAAASVMLGIIVIFLLEQRICFINILLNPLKVFSAQENEDGSNGH